MAGDSSGGGGDSQQGGSGTTSREAGASTNTLTQPQGAKSGGDEVPERIKAMDELIGEHVNAFVEASKGLDNLVEEQVRLFSSGDRTGYV